MRRALRRGKLSVRVSSTQRSNMWVGREWPLEWGRAAGGTAQAGGRQDPGGRGTGQLGDRVGTPAWMLQGGKTAVDDTTGKFHCHIDVGCQRPGGECPSFTAGLRLCPPCVTSGPTPP